MHSKKKPPRSQRLKGGVVPEMGTTRGFNEKTKENKSKNKRCKSACCISECLILFIFGFSCFVVLCFFCAL